MGGEGYTICMAIHPLAGQPAPASVLVDVSKLIAAYFSEKPDTVFREQRVAFGTSGHRGSSFKRSFNERHILAITQAICEYRASQCTVGPLYLGRDTHALSEPAYVSAIEVLAANGIEVATHEVHPELAYRQVVMVDGSHCEVTDGVSQPRDACRHPLAARGPRGRDTARLRNGEVRRGSRGPDPTLPQHREPRGPHHRPGVFSVRLGGPAHADHPVPDHCELKWVCSAGA